MEVGLIGLNHKCADLNLREKILCAARESLEPSALYETLDSFVVLITCNRVEIYFSAQDLSRAHTFLLSILRHHLCIDFEHKLYSYFRWDCFSHLCHVTSGLDSAVLAETEIQGQVKKAYLHAQNKGFLHPDLHFLFQKSLKIGKDLRTSFFKDSKSPSLEGTLAHLIQENFSQHLNTSILFVGASEINLSILKDFKNRGYQCLTLLNRSLNKAKALVGKEKISILPWEQLCQWKDYEVIIFATKCPQLLLQYDEKASYRGKKLILDLSVPRDVDKNFAKVPGYELMNMDQVNRLVRVKSALKKTQIQGAQQSIGEAIGRVIRAYKKKLENDYLYRSLQIAN